jgi:hypothetical protein
MSSLRFVALSTLAMLIGACADASTRSPSASTAPSLAERSRAGSDAPETDGSGGDARVVRMRDECDPTTFDAALHDPNACTGNGHITFDHFVAELTKTQQAPQWRFDPGVVELDPHRSLLAVNRGGEVHTFTRVAKFGGGIVPFLNNLSGNPVAAPECLTLEGDDFVAPGGTYTAELSTDRLQHFQCCIHPWMRADVRMR